MIFLFNLLTNKNVQKFKKLAMLSVIKSIEHNNVNINCLHVYLHKLTRLTFLFVQTSMQCSNCPTFIIKNISYLGGLCF